MAHTNSKIEELNKKINELNNQNEILKNQLNYVQKFTDIIKKYDLKYLAVLNNVPLPILIIDFDKNHPGKIIFANTSFLTFVDKTSTEIIGKSPKQFFKKKKNPYIPIYSEATLNRLKKKKNINIEGILESNKNEKIVNISATLIEQLHKNFLLVAFRDLTRELKYLRDIEEKEHRYRSFIDNSESPIYRIAFSSPVSIKMPTKKLAEKIFSEGYLAECNYSFAKFMGFGNQNLLIGKTFEELFGSFDNPRNKKEILDFIKNKFVLRNRIVKVQAVDGKEIFLSKNVFGDIEDNKLLQVWAVFHDITELEKIKLNLESSRDEFQKLFEFSPVPMALVNENLEVQAFNKQMVDAFGYETDDIPSLHALYKTAFRHLSSPEKIQKKWKALVFSAARNRNRTITEETSLVTKKGELRNIFVSFSLIGNKFLISVNDITETKKAKEEAERAKKIIENSPNVLLQWELKGNRVKLVYITQNITSLGYSAEDFLSGKIKFNDIIANVKHNKIFSERKKLAAEGKTKLTQQFQIKTASGEIRCFESYISIVRENNKTAFWEVLSDITEKRKTELKLRESIERYKSVFDNSPLGIFHFDSNGIIIGFNEQFVEILNSSREKLLGFNLLKALKNKEVLKAVRETLDGKKGYYEGHYTSVTSGKSLYIRMLTQPIFDENGKVISGVGLWEDVTERIEARNEIERTRDEFRQTAEQLNFILNHINDIVYEQDKNKNLIFVSGSVKKLLGYSPTEFMLRRRNIITNNPLNKRIDPAIEDVLTRRKNTRYYVELFAKNGKKILLEVNESPIIKKNEISGLIGVARDVTETFRNQQVQKAIHNIAVKTYEAKSLDELYKYIHKTIEQFMPAKNFFIAVFDPVVNKLSFQYYVDETDEETPEPKEPRNGFTEFAIRTKQNAVWVKEELHRLLQEGKFELIGELPEAVAVSYIKFSDGKQGVIVLQDYENPGAYSKEDIQFLKFVSTQIVQSIEKKRADDELIKTNKILRKTEKELREQTEELRKINANKDKLFSIISHDLRSPFTAMLGLTQMLREMYEDMTKEEIGELVEALNNSATNLFKLLENLLNWSRIQLGSFKILPQNINFYEIVLSVVNALSEPARQKDITLINKVDDSVSVFADPPTVETIVRNLVNNAIKFTRAGGEIIIDARQISDNMVEIAVADNGIGMNEEILNSLFRVDKKVSRPGTQSEAGTGLGLILVKELVEKNGGKIWVTSKENEGSIFYFTLPIEG